MADDQDASDVADLLALAYGDARDVHRTAAMQRVLAELDHGLARRAAEH